MQQWSVHYEKQKKKGNKHIIYATTIEWKNLICKYT
jgi:hypothetical protein